MTEDSTTYATSDFRWTKCEQLETNFDDRYPAFEILFRLLLFVLCGMNILLIWISFKKQKENWDSTRFFIITTAVIDILCLIIMSVPSIVYNFYAEHYRFAEDYAKSYIILLAYPKALLVVFLLAGIHRLRTILNKPRPTRMSLIVQTTVLVIVVEVVLLGAMEIVMKVDNSGWINLSVYYRVAILFQVSLIITNFIVHGIIYRRTKLVAQQIATYQSDDVTLQDNVNFDLKSEIEKKAAVSFAVVVILSSLLCLPNMFLLGIVARDFVAPVRPCMFMALDVLMELASFNCVINPWIYYVISPEFRAPVNKFFNRLCCDLVCKGSSTDQ